MEGPSSQGVWVGVEFSLLEMSFPSAGQAVFFFPLIILIGQMQTVSIVSIFIKRTPQKSVY